MKGSSSSSRVHHGTVIRTVRPSHSNVMLCFCSSIFDPESSCFKHAAGSYRSLQLESKLRCRDLAEGQQKAWCSPGAIQDFKSYAFVVYPVEAMPT